MIGTFMQVEQQSYALSAPASMHAPPFHLFFLFPTGTLEYLQPQLHEIKWVATTATRAPSAAASSTTHGQRRAQAERQRLRLCW